MRAKKNIGELSRKLLDTKVGFVRITEPQKYRQNYEVAAWYTDYESDLGDFDLFLRADYLYPDQLSVTATVPATVVSNYHAPLFGGVAFGPSRDDRGNRGTIPVCNGWAEAAGEQRHRQGCEFVIDRDHLDAAIEYAEVKMREYADAFPDWYDKYKAEPRNDFHSNIGMVAHFGGNIETWGRLLQEILRQKDYRFGSFACYEKTQVYAEEAVK